MWEKLLKDFWLLFATMDPVGTMLLFLGLTRGMSGKERRGLALRAVLNATVILVGALVVGQIVLDYLGIRMVSMELAGGLILFLFGLKMFFDPESEEAGASEGGKDLAVFPLALPSIASPGAILAVMLITDNDRYSIEEQAMSGVALLVVILLTVLALLAAGRIYRLIGKAGARILIRLMGFLICALAAEFVLAALESLYVV